MKKFRDFSISRKLYTGFLAMIVLMVVVGGVGTFGMIRINSMDTYLYEKQTAPISNLIGAYEALYQVRVDVRDAIIYSNDPAKVEEHKNSYQKGSETFLKNIELYRPSINNASTLALLDEVKKIYNETYVPAVEQTFKVAGQNKPQEAASTINAISDSTNLLFEKMGQMVDNRMSSAKSSSDSNNDTAVMLIIVLCVFIVLGAFSAMLLGMRISRIITKPIGRVVDAAGQIALGRMDVDLSDVNSKDETGELAAAFTKMLEGIQKQVLAAEVISRGDFTQAVPLRSNEDALGLALEKIKTDLNDTLQLISMAADQVNTGSEQVSSAAQALSSGATEQAASVEELNASIVSVAQQATRNATSVSDATNYVEQAGKGLSDSNEYMQRLDAAMHEIGESSQEISKITKLVEDIAFQTNILALNAAVEAARAGNAGKGFAVVADEVRNLAAKSAEAAKQTADLIAKSVVTVSEGKRLATETLSALSEVSEKSQMVNQAIIEIESASTEQAAAIEQINQGLSQVSAVVQNNAATAEESSASSEELAAQAQTLQGEVSKFKLAGLQGYPSSDPQKRRRSEAIDTESWLALQNGADKY
ncbi:methyl-accepting chemotaxis protein [Faecalispora anaeroviscerum]|uniref:methyl-accepting chemotaxis protein n=1 Tax=Faecalispora anaeroviscerum TaxID=2991836 RepID=UPI0024BA2CDE|nr:HAMP domain-containing methyl-accepting chemotaxis protein [Faecalispora anaeroviscerum]